MSSPSPEPGHPRRRSPLPALGLIGAVVLIVALAFGWVGGWLDRDRLTAQRMVDTIEGGNPHPGFRRAHSKGICVSGYFEPTAAGPRLSKARVFAQPRVPVLGRMSIGGGDPHGADATARVRSMALRLRTDDGQEWRTAMNSFPFFPVATPEAFQAQTLASRPDPATGRPDPAAMEAFLAQHPEARRFLEWAKTAPWPTSFANTRFNGVNAFRFVDAAEGSRFVRWSMRPQAPLETLPAEARERADADYLQEDLVARLAAAPLRWDMVATVAAADDPVTDPSQPWPEDREQVVLGTLVLEDAQPQATGPCRDLNYDPLVLPEGIEGSGDPVLAARSATYSVSFNRRQREIAAGDAAAATGTEGAR
ncbi:catalase family peroxidase [Coralloluteibacterium stylophorae]|uniref:Catalase-related peroxidase n=1 Tax=Coralloluteibacterium stylophorae TaxID=1776034 RepID=A0A8J7VVP8_9GAMM|nr:catalase family peroxidase [Coralloluteibacterium stylophorae]MBS7458646.1 catalase family peroxidase [Coralloluteibacterium stylophorae]